MVMFVGKVEPIVYGSKSLGRFYVLEQPDGKQLVVEQYVEPASALKAQRAVARRGSPDHGADPTAGTRRGGRATGAAPRAARTRSSASRAL